MADWFHTSRFVRFLLISSIRIYCLIIIKTTSDYNAFNLNFNGSPFRAPINIKNGTRELSEASTKISNTSLIKGQASL